MRGAKKIAIVETGPKTNNQHTPVRPRTKKKVRGNRKEPAPKRNLTQKELFKPSSDICEV